MEATPFLYVIIHIRICGILEIHIFIGEILEIEIKPFQMSAKINS